METSVEKKCKIHHTFKIIIFVLIVLCAGKFLLSYGNFGKNGNAVENTISFTGHGEVSAVPDIANISFTIEKDAKTVKESQALVAEIEKKAIDLLKTNNVAERDIKTNNASFYPKYEFQNKGMPCTRFVCPTGENVIVGYTSSESISVKIRNTDDTGKIIQGLGEIRVSNLNGPNFSIDKEDALKDSARKLAINEAKEKAKKLSKDLGIRLGKITSFSENRDYPMPMYAKAEMAMGMDTVSLPAELPKGENLITSDVTITYEIK
ncbi:MAG: SIMPL domain-containing protein [Candidatus Paceibacterota bacterium]